MLRQGFIQAMSADIRLCRYSKPDVAVVTQAEWLLVSRWGDVGEYLCISMAGPRATDGAGAPPTIKPALSLLGVLFASSPSRQTREFLIIAEAAPSVRLAGAFLPANGYARLVGPACALRLEAVARSAPEHRVEGDPMGRNGRFQVEAAAGETIWQIEANRTEWVGNFAEQSTLGSA